MAIRETPATEQQSPKRRKYQFGVRALLLASLGVSILASISAVVWRHASSPVQPQAARDLNAFDVVTSEGVRQVNIPSGEQALEAFGQRIDAAHLIGLIKQRNEAMKGKPEIPWQHTLAASDRQVMLAVLLLIEAKEPKAFDALVGLVQDPFWQMRECAAEALRRHGDRHVLPILLQVLQDPENRSSKQSLLQAIAELGDDSAVPPLINTMPAGGYRDVEERLTAIETITGLSLQGMRNRWGRPNLAFYVERLTKFQNAMRAWWEENKANSRNGETVDPAIDELTRTPTPTREKKR